MNETLTKRLALGTQLLSSLRNSTLDGWSSFQYTDSLYLHSKLYPGQLISLPVELSWRLDGGSRMNNEEQTINS